MVKLVIIADDFTGAVDTGVQFAQQGVATQVVLDTCCDLSRLSAATQVAVIDAETRHLPPEKAGQVVYRIARQALRAGALIYKKTDSALRGCVGSELAAVLDASDARQLVFLPAFPDQERYTIDGTQYLGNTPVHESVFGQDPFEPVPCSNIPDLIARQSNVPVTVCGGGDLGEHAQGIVVFDACTNNDLLEVGRKLARQGRLRLMAGCAGFASLLPDLLEFKRQPVPAARRTQGLFVVCGSLNPITRRQMDYAHRSGFYRIQITPEQKLAPDYLQSPHGRAFIEELRRAAQQYNRLILDTFGENSVEGTDEYARRQGIDPELVRHSVAQRMGEFAREWLRLGLDYTVFLTGGDTLLGFMSQLGCREIQPLGEIAGGAILSLLHLPERTVQVVSKSGGFGDEPILLDVADRVM